MYRFAYTTGAEDITKPVYPSRLKENAKFVYNELSEMVDKRRS